MRRLAGLEPCSLPLSTAGSSAPPRPPPGGRSRWRWLDAGCASRRRDACAAGRLVRRTSRVLLSLPSGGGTSAARSACDSGRRRPQPAGTRAPCSLTLSINGSSAAAVWHCAAGLCSVTSGGRGGSPSLGGGRPRSPRRCARGCATPIAYSASRSPPGAGSLPSACVVSQSGDASPNGVNGFSTLLVATEQVTPAATRRCAGASPRGTACVASRPIR